MRGRVILRGSESLLEQYQEKWSYSIRSNIEREILIQMS